MSSKRMSSKLFLTSAVVGNSVLTSAACPGGYVGTGSNKKKSYPGLGSVNGVGGKDTLVRTQEGCADLCNADYECGSFEYDSNSKECQLNLTRFAISKMKEGDAEFCTKEHKLVTLDPPVFNADGNLSGLRWFSSVWAPATDHPNYEQWKEDNMHGSLHTTFGWWSSALAEHLEGPHWMAIDIRMNSTDANGVTTSQPRLACGAIVAGRGWGEHDPHPYWPTRTAFRYSMDGQRWYGAGGNDGNTVDNYKLGVEVQFRQCVKANYIRWDIKEMNDPSARPGGRCAVRVVDLDVEKDTPLAIEKDLPTCEDGSTNTITTADECRQAMTLLNAVDATSNFYKEASEFEFHSGELPIGCIVAEHKNLNDFANYPFAKTVKFNTASSSGIKCNTYGDVNCLCTKKKGLPNLNAYEASATLGDGSVNNKGFCRIQSKMMTPRNDLTNALQCRQACFNDPLCGYVTFNSNPLSGIALDGSEPEPRCMLYQTEACDMSQPETGLRVLKRVGYHYQRVSDRFAPHETMKTWKNANQELGFTHKGCYPTIDFPETKKAWKHRALQYKSRGFWGLRYKHRAMCSRLCEGHKFFGMKFRANAEHPLGGTSRCFCGEEIQENKDGNRPDPVDASYCNHTCEGDVGHTCGSSTHMDIYEHSDSRRRLGEASKGLSLPEAKNMNTDVEEEEDEDEEDDMEEEDRRDAVGKAIKKSLRGSKRV